MRVLIDDNIPGLVELLAGKVEFLQMNGREIDSAAVRGFDVLLCRSQTRVDAELIAASRLRFVATATSGTDHIDTSALLEAGVPFADAHGSNAVAVADYVLGAVARHCLERGADVRRLQFGIVGHGAVGRVLAERVRRLGAGLLVSDPPLAASGLVEDVPLATLAGADVVSLHVPLVSGGSWPTRHLIDEKFLEAMQPGSLLVNAARGGVVDEPAWRRAMSAGKCGVVDTWVGEPCIDRSLARGARWATTHIAGHSFDAKLAGTRMVASAFAEATGVQLDLDHLAAVLPQAAPPRQVRLESLGDVYRAVAEGYDLARDDAATRALLGLSDQALGRGFDRYRRLYPIRRDFAVQRIEATGSSELAALLAAFGFPVMA